MQMLPWNEQIAYLYRHSGCSCLAVHYNDVIMCAMASQITSLTMDYSTVYSRRRSKEASKLRVTGLCEGNSPVTSEFPAQMVNNAENDLMTSSCKHKLYGNMDDIAQHAYHVTAMKQSIFETRKSKTS